MNHLCYEYYTTAYGGSAIAQADWPLYAKRAEAQMARLRRVYSLWSENPESFDLATCALADTIQSFDIAMSGAGGPVKSAGVGSVSESYAIKGEIDISAQGQERAILDAIATYLDVYRGVGLW